jgi:hypothetical protein
MPQSDELIERVARAIHDTLDLSEGLKLDMAMEGEFSKAARAAITALQPIDGEVERLIATIRERAKQQPSPGLMERQGLDEKAIRYGQALLLAVADELSALNRDRLL